MFETLLSATSMICGVGVNVSNHQVSEPTQVVNDQVESNSISRSLFLLLRLYELFWKIHKITKINS